VSAQFYYDGKNRQIARNINGVVRFNSWDGWDLLEEYSSSLNVVTGYLQGATGVIKSWSAANTLYYYQDKLGSTTHVANASGQLVESYHYGRREYALHDQRFFTHVDQRDAYRRVERDGPLDAVAGGHNSPGNRVQARDERFGS